MNQPTVFNTLRIHAAYASAALCGFLLLLEYLLPGSVLPYVPLFPLCFFSFLLIVFMPEKTYDSMADLLWLVLISALLFGLILFTLKHIGGVLGVVFIGAMLGMLVLVTMILFPRGK